MGQNSEFKSRSIHGWSNDFQQRAKELNGKRIIVFSINDAGLVGYR